MSTIADYPADVVTERDRQLYARGWRDRITHVTSAAGRSTSVSKAEAARRNGRKGGKPPPSKMSLPRRILAIARRSPGVKITVSPVRLKFEFDD